VRGVSTLCFKALWLMDNKHLVKSAFFFEGRVKRMMIQRERDKTRGKSQEGLRKKKRLRSASVD